MPHELPNKAAVRIALIFAWKLPVKTPSRRLGQLMLPLVASLAIAGCGSSESGGLSTAKERLAKGDFAGAEVTLRHVIQKFPRSAEARYLLGKQLLAKGDVKAARVELARANEGGFNNDLVLPPLARALVMSGEAKKVIDDHAAVKLQDPAAMAALHAALVMAHAAVGDRAKAAATLEAALKQRADDPSLLTAKAQLAMASGDLATLASTVSVLNEKYPNNEEGWALKGDLTLRTRDDQQGAIDAYRKALSLNPAFARVRAALVALHINRKELADAKREFERLNKDAPTFFMTKVMEARLAIATNNIPRARTVYQAMLKASPSHPLLLTDAAEVELRLGSYIQAESLARKALAASPASEAAQRILAQALLRKGDVARSLEILAPMVTKPDAPAELLAMAAEAELMSGDVRAADALFKRVTLLKPTDPVLRATVAKAVHRGNPEALLAELQTIAATDDGVTADTALLTAKLTLGDAAGALAAAEAIRKKQPESASPLYLQSLAHSLKKDYAGARAALEAALAKNEAYIPALSGLAALDVLEGKTANAPTRLQTLVKKQPNNAAAKLALADVLQRSGGATSSQVRSLLEGAVKVAPLDSGARQALVTFHQNRSEFREAATVAEAGLAQAPDNLSLLEQLSKLQLQSGQADQALTTLAKIVAQDPNALVGHLGMARVNLVSGNLPQAEQALKRALAAHPKDVQTQRLVVTLRTAQKRHDEAVVAARSLQQQLPKQAIGFAAEADAESARGQWDAVAKALRQALDRAPSSSSLAAQLHRSLLRASKGGDAEGFATGWLKQHPEDVLFMHHLADTAEAANDLTTAESYYRRVTAAQPKAASAWNNLAMVTLRQKKPGALPMIETALKLAPDNANFLDTLADVHAAEGHLDKAIAAQSSAVENGGKSVAYRLKLARFKLQAGEKREAKTEMDRLASSDLQLTEAQRQMLRQLNEDLRK